MFGNRPYAEHFELCVPKSIFENWGNVFEDHELSLFLLKWRFSTRRVKQTGSRCCFC